MVVLHILVPFIMSSCLWALTTPLAAKELIAKHHCETRCGNVQIPFPFGIGTNCSIDNNWFQVVCNKSTTTHRAFLKRLNLEVTNISVEGTLRVKAPITFQSCSRAANNEAKYKAVSLTRSPFVFSRKENRFTAVSCGVPAVMRSRFSYLHDVKHLAACTSVCPGENRTENDRCNGMDYCQTTIPSYLQDFKIDFEDNNDGNCKYAFLVEQKWFESNSKDYTGIREMDYVPVMLNWDLILSEITANFEKKHGLMTSICNKTKAKSSRDETSLQCSCISGYKGNPYLPKGCQDKELGNNGSKLPFPVHKVKMLLIGVCSGMGMLVLIFCVWASHKTIEKRKVIKRKEKFFKRNGGLLIQKQISSSSQVLNMERIKLFDSKELDKATDHFNVNRVLGKGGQGTVYKGMLADGRIVAVKKSIIVDEANLAEFINEVVILSQINHRNVVKLLGCCLETEVPLLIYELVSNGNLFQLIHEQNEEFPFTWEMRLRIATEVAGALSYLHSAASFPIYHRDIKSTNILLDCKYRAKVADFGTSRSVSLDKTHLTTSVHGTFGYLDPEYFLSSQFTEKSDVYSFGVVLVELLTGQKAVSITRSKKGRSLVTYFITSMEEDRLFDILDTQVMKGSKKEVMVVADLARRCLNLDGKKRPTMKELAMELEGVQMFRKEEIIYVTTDSTQRIKNWDVSISQESALDGTSTY